MFECRCPDRYDEEGEFIHEQVCTDWWLREEREIIFPDYKYCYGIEYRDSDEAKAFIQIFKDNILEPASALFEQAVPFYERLKEAK